MTNVILQLFIASSIPVLKVILLCSVGALAARKVSCPLTRHPPLLIFIQGTQHS